MEVFMKRDIIEEMLTSLGFESIYVDETDSRMDIWDLDSADLDTVAEKLGPSSKPIGDPMAMCSHARKAAERRAREEVESFLSKDRESGIHWGSPQFDHVREFDMSDLC